MRAFAMQLASALHGEDLPLGAPVENLLSASEADAGGSEIPQALVRPRVVVSLDEDADLALEVGGVGVVAEQDLVLNVWCQCSILPCVCGW